MPKLVRDIMKTDVVTVELNTSMRDLQRIFLSAKVGALPVLDRDDKLRGIASRSDIVRTFAVEQSLAELLEAGFDPVQGEGDDASDLKSLDAIGAAVGRRLAKMCARDIMITDIASIGPDATLEEAARLMLGRRIHRLPVVKADCLVGIISTFDFMALYASDPV